LGKHVNKTELSEILGKSHQTLTTWQKNGLPILIDGANGQQNIYDTERVIEWLVKNRLERALGSSSGSFDYDAERARLTHHQANKAEIEAQMLRKDSVSLKKMRGLWIDVTLLIRNKLLSTSKKLAPMLVTESSVSDIDRIITDEITEILHELSTGLNELDEPEGIDTDSVVGGDQANNSINGVSVG